jgi:UDPglucose--hexose-1-phosphate uridylyltransferase
MSELRWHPLLRQWVVVSAHRQHRPQMPHDWCPFCPGSGRVPDQYDVYLYPNDFAALHLGNDPFRANQEGLFETNGARGACDVVLYHSHHTLLPSQLSVEHWKQVIQLWTRRFDELSHTTEIQYVAVFENTGLAIGVTMPHPHGQIYAFPFVPPQVQVELTSASEYYTRHDRCLYCDILERELHERVRIVAENDTFVALVPFFARFPAEIQIYPKRHFTKLTRMEPAEFEGFASILSIVRRKYDNLFGTPMPLMMLLRQSPTKGKHPYFHFHVDFYPIQRSNDKLKYLAAVETGTGTFLNDTLAEEKAQELRDTDPVTL